MIFRKLDTFVENNLFSDDQFRSSSQQFEGVDDSISLRIERDAILNSRSYDSIGGPSI